MLFLLELFSLSCLYQLSWAQKEPPAAFGSAQNIMGNYERTDVDFVDGLAVDLLSPSNRTFTITQNSNALAGNFVSGANGEGWRAIQPYSYIINTNVPANDMIAKVELPYDPVMLRTMGIDQSDTAVGRLAPDGKSWMISESQRNVHVTENKTRIIKMTSIAGEYRLLGRTQADKANIFVQYGQGATRTVNITGGPGRQEAEFIDGLRFSVEANQPLIMNVDVKPLARTIMVPDSMRSLNSFAWVVNTSVSTLGAAPPPPPPPPPPPAAPLSPAAPIPPMVPLPSVPIAAVPEVTAIAPSRPLTPASTALNPIGLTLTPGKRQSPGLPLPVSPMIPSTSQPNSQGMIRTADIRFPLNTALLNSMMNLDIQGLDGMDMLTPLQSLTGPSPSPLSQLTFSIGRRTLGASNAAFTVIQSGVSVNQGGQLQGNGLATGVVMTGDGLGVKISGLSELDGEYVVLVAKAPGAGLFADAKEGLTKTSNAMKSSGTGVETLAFFVLIVWCCII